MARIAQILLLLLLLQPLYGVAAPQGGDAGPLPGLAEVVPRLALLTEEAMQTREELRSLAETTPLQDRLEASRERLVRLEERAPDLSGHLGWGYDRLLGLRARLAEEKGSLAETLDEISNRLSLVEEAGKRWNERKLFWKRWREGIQGEPFRVPPQEFGKALDAIDEVLRAVASSTRPLVQLQQDAATLQGKVATLLGRLEGAISGQTFRKVASPLTSGEYLEQFDERLWAQVKSGATEVQGISGEFWRNQGWIFALQLLLVCALALFIIHHRPKAVQTEEWQFLLRHPWAAGTFAATSILGLLYVDPPDIWTLLLWLSTAFSAAILICALLKNPRKRFTVWLLTVLFVLSLVLRVVSLPLPLYRLYLALLAGGLTPLFLVLASRNRHAPGGRLDGFTFALRCGAAVLLVSCVAQIAGYSILSFRLIESSLKTLFLGLLAAMAVKLGQGAIDFLLDQDFFRRWRFFRRFGNELTTRLKDLFLVLVVACAMLYLLEVWYIYDSMAEAWSALLGLGFTVANVPFTVSKVLVIVLVLYVSVITSWVIRSVLEAEVFPRRRFDRGVRDSIKKLLHYSLVFLGFLFAMSLAGVELKNFAVLAGAFGIGIGFGLQNIVNNFVSGLILLFERPVKVGDMVVIDDVWGTVGKIGLRSTVVTTLDESEIIVPNSQLVAEKVTNWSLSSPLCRVSLPVGVAYGSDVPLVLRILVETGESHPSVLKDPPPSPLFQGFGESSLDFELRVWISDVRDRLRVRSDLCQEIDRRFRDAGVEIPFPQRDLHLRSVAGNILRGRGGQQQNGAPDTASKSGEKDAKNRPGSRKEPGRP